jgi:hypothetical protein
VRADKTAHGPGFRTAGRDCRHSCARLREKQTNPRAAWREGGLSQADSGTTEYTSHSSRADRHVPNSRQIWPTGL